MFKELYTFLVIPRCVDVKVSTNLLCRLYPDSHFYFPPFYLVVSSADLCQPFKTVMAAIFFVRITIYQMMLTGEITGEINTTKRRKQTNRCCHFDRNYSNNN